MPRHPSRRMVVRTAVWTTPAVAVATAAPALAVSTTTTPILSFDTLNLFGADYVAGDPTTLESQVQVQNRYAATSPTLMTLTLTVSYPDVRVPGAAPTQVSGTGWTYASAAHFGSDVGLHVRLRWERAARVVDAAARLPGPADVRRGRDDDHHRVGLRVGRVGQRHRVVQGQVTGAGRRPDAGR